MDGTTAEEASHDDPPPAAVPKGGLRRRVLQGGLIMSVVAVAVRTSSFIAQLVLGRLLVEEEFGLYALALSFVTIQASVRSIMRPVLIEAVAKNPGEATYLHRTIVYTLGVLAVAGIGLSPILGRLFDEPDLAWLLVPMFALMPFQLAPTLGVSRLAEAMQFSKVGRVEAVAGFVRHATTIAAAFAGLGPFSFVVGALGAAATEIVMVRWFLGTWPSLGPPDLTLLRERAGAALQRGQTRRWIWVSAIALSLGAAGDYLGASITSTIELVGLYFFAYQLTGALFVPMNLAASTVLVPAFTRIDDTASRRSSYLATTQALTVTGTLFFMAVSIALAPLMHLMWGGRWDDSIVAAVLFALYAPVRLTHPSTQNVARACGYWTLFVTDMILVGSITFVAAVIGGAVGGLGPLTLFVVGGHLLVTLSAAMRLGRRFEASLVTIVRTILQPWLLGLAAVGITHLVGNGIDSTAWSDLAINAAVLLPLLVVLVVVPERRVLLGLVDTMRRRGGTSAAAA